MGGRVLVLLTLCCCAGGCSVDPLEEEYTREDCSDERDNDLDQLVDCEEATCRVYTHCYPRLTDGGPGPDSVAGPIDEGGDPPTQCGPGRTCGAGFACASGYCVQPDVVALELESVTAEVPRATGRDRELVQCIDNSCSLPAPRLPEFPFCECRPDPFVDVVINGSSVWSAPVREEADQASWAVAAGIRFAPGSLVRFELRDRQASESVEIYSCVAAADRVAIQEGRLRCGRAFHVFTGPDATRRYEVDAAIRVMR